MISGLLWNFLALIIVGIISFLYSKGNANRKKEVRKMLKTVLSIWLVTDLVIIIIFYLTI